MNSPIRKEIFQVAALWLMHIYQVIFAKPIFLAIIVAKPAPQIDEFRPVLAYIFAQVTPGVCWSYLGENWQLVRRLFDVRQLAAEQRYAERFSRPRENFQLNRRATSGINGCKTFSNAIKLAFAAVNPCFCGAPIRLATHGEPGV